MMRLLLLGMLALGLMTAVAIGKDKKDNDKDFVSVPEPSQVVSALTLLAGSTLILRGRRKK